MADTSCLKTVVRNISGKRKPFPFLPPHGVTLDPGQEHAFFGTFSEVFGGHVARRRLLKGAFASLGRDLALVSTPAQHAFDITLDQTKIVTVDNGATAVADPCWGTYSSSIGG